jgi:tetratricopeptide (TPR) repeat protein
LFTLPGTLYGTALGFALGLYWPARRARLAFVLWSLGTYAWTLWNLLREPPIFGYNAFVGYFPGPLYDREISITGSLLLARGTVLMEAVLFALLAVLGWDGSRWRVRALRLPWSGARGVAGGVALLDLLVLGLLFAHADALGLRIGRRYIQEQLGGRLETEHCRIFYDTGAYTPEQARELAGEHEFHWAELRAFFGFAPPRPIASYVYASGEQKKRLMGAGGTSFEDALNDELHVNAARYPHPVLRHEMAHLFAAHLHRWLRICPQIGIHEGIAVAAEWREESARLGLTPDEACVAMDSLEVLPDIRRIMGAFGFWTQAGSRVYTAAGSFVRYLVDTYGMERLRVLWGSRSFRKAYGRPLDDLASEWRRSRLGGVRLRPGQLRRAEQLFRPPAIFQEPCAHEQARLRSEAAVALSRRDFMGADSLYAELARIDSSDHEPVLERARALVLGGRAGEARLALLELLDAAPLSDPARGKALHQLGDALWTLGNLDEAERAYVEAAELAPTRSEARALGVALRALRDSSLSESLRPYLVEWLPDAAAFALLAPLRAARPEAAIPRYLLGRRLYFAERFQEALGELVPLIRDDTLPADVRLEALEVSAQSELRRGHPEEALALLAGLEGFMLEAADELRLEDIRHRADWARSQPTSPSQAAPSPSNP